MRMRTLQRESGFTLLEVLVAITVLGVGSAVAISLMSGSLGNIQKVQLSTRIIEQAESVMEETLLDDTILNPTTLGGSFDDGTNWTMNIEDYVPPVLTDEVVQAVPQNMPVKLLQYTIQITSLDPKVKTYTLQTLKVVNATTTSQ